MKWLAPVILLALASVSDADPAPVPIRRVELSFIVGGTVISNPASLVGGDGCQTFSHGLVGEPPRVSIEQCATADDHLRIRWLVRHEGRVLAHEVTGSFAEGATFDAGIPNTIEVPVHVTAALP